MENNVSSTLKQRLLEPIILRFIAEKDRYSYELSKYIRERFGAPLLRYDGTLLAYLKLYENNHLLTSYLDESGERPRRYYKLHKSVLPRLEQIKIDAEYLESLFNSAPEASA